MRTTKVATSFECRAARDGVVLVDRPAAVDVDWNKEMVMPADDYEEAVERLKGARNALGALLLQLRPDPIEMGELDEEDVRDRRQIRWHRGCGEAHMAVELAVKALLHLEADIDRPAWGHDIGKLCARLPEPRRRALSALLEPLGADAITPWRVTAVYNSTDTTPELPAEPARTACRVASYVADQFPAAVRPVAGVRMYAGRIEDYLAGYALDSGEPL